MLIFQIKIATIKITYELVTSVKSHTSRHQSLNERLAFLHCQDPMSNLTRLGGRRGDTSARSYTSSGKGDLVCCCLESEHFYLIISKMKKKKREEICQGKGQVN